MLHADNHLLAVAKPAGVPVVPDDSRDPCLLDAAKAWIKREHGKPGDVFLGVVHRLDRPVSGVVLFARTSKAAGRLAESFRTRSVRKGYLALSDGAPGGSEGLVEQWLRKDAARNRVHVVPEGSPDARLARTRWRVGEPVAGHTLLELEPETGRSHQLRVAAASLGCVLLGDLKYGADEPLPDASVALHAARLEVDHPTRREPVVIECPPPERPWWGRG